MASERTRDRIECFVDCVAEFALALVGRFKLSEIEALREVRHSRFCGKPLNPGTALVAESRAAPVYLYMQQRAA